MSDAELSRENAALRRRNEQLVREVANVTQALGAFERGEVDAVTVGASTTPVLLQAAQESLRHSEQLLRAIFDGALDPMVLTDQQARFVDANLAACELYAVSRAELLGRRISDFAGTEIADASAYQTFREQGRMQGQFELPRADGTRRVVEFSSVAGVTPGLDLSVMRDVTERTEALEALRRNEALFRAVIEKSSEVISLTAADGTTRYLTPSAWRLLGWTPEEMGTRTLRDQVIPEDRALIAAELQRLVQTGARDMSLEFQVMHRDGSIRWIESTGTNLLDNPDVRAIVGNYRDITARKQAAAELKASRDLLEEAQAIAHVGSWTAGIGPDTEINWSRECYRIFGIPEGTRMTVAAFFLAVHPDDRGRVIRASRAATEEGAPYDIEHRLLWPDGTVRRVHERAIVERDGRGQPVRILGTLQDITDRHATLEALRESEVRYRRIVESTSDGIWIYDANLITTFMNARMASMLGYTVEEAVGLHILVFMDEEQYATARERVARRRQGISERSSLSYRRKDGSKLWTSYQATPLLDASGNFEAVLVVATDISSQRHAEEARAHLAAIVESSEDAILGVSAAGLIMSWNAGAEKLYAYPAAAAVGESSLMLIPAEVVDTERDTVARVVGGEAVGQYETKRRRKDGSIVEVAVTASPIRDAAGVVIGVSRIERDLTVRRATEAKLQRTEEQFRQAQKMEAVGRLAGGVAHDFNNLLSVVLSYSSMASLALKEGDPLRDDLLEIHKAGPRATDLTRQLLAFSRQQVLQPRVLDLNQIVSGMEAMLHRLLGEDVELTISAESALGRVLADPGQLEQVVMNLAVNARDAMPQGGKLTIETANVELDEGYVAAHFGVVPGEYVMLAASDTGIGMDAATQARIFEPFFTTKEKGKGTGLGLSTVIGIVEQSNGHVGVYSEVGQGCTFKVYLPRTDRLADAVVAASPAVVLGGSETILLVEDEEQVRAVACAILRRRGYHVLEASNGGEALLTSREFPARIHLLMTDVVMPRMSGRRLVDELAPQRPDMRVLFASGYTDDAIVHHGVLNAGVAFIQKPFTPDTLLRKVREVLDARDSRT